MSMGVRKYATLQHHLFVTSRHQLGSQLTATAPATVEDEYVVAGERDAWGGRRRVQPENPASGRPAGSAAAGAPPRGPWRASASQTGGRCRGRRGWTGPATSRERRAQGNAQQATP